ncbi:PREDICTED: tankyrase-2-like [Branchiostoma belcheri]|uniref:Tankyrase-2-like n=1 Tax=Branchiostoma belcheri TaxID=7741 RepID=A0A6P4ZY36_BRABE|nr:PREDICTED: tankyrase-2-like [Branchiostoma belcheri]
MMNVDMAEKASEFEALVQAAALEAGTDIDYTKLANEVVARTGRNPALYMASFFGHVDIVKMLLRTGASLTKRTEKSSSAPLHGAAIGGYTEVVDLLVQHGATLDVRDAYQRTPIMAACMFKKVHTVKRLIELGARLDLVDCYSQTADMYCFWDIVGEVGDRDCMVMMKMIREAMKTGLLRCCNPTCGKPGYRATLKLCAQCKLTRYCSRDCQKQHWTVGHKKCCGHDAYTSTGETPTKVKEWSGC